MDLIESNLPADTEVVPLRSKQNATAEPRRDGSEIDRYCDLIEAYLSADYQKVFRPAGGPFAFCFLTPGSRCYDDALWDWDCWLSNVALRQILVRLNSPEAWAEALPYEQGCVLNYLAWCEMDGWIPVCVARADRISDIRPTDIHRDNMHKPVLAQHAAFLVRELNGDAGWLREGFDRLQAFINNYRSHHRHPCGLYFWQTDSWIGVDNDPCTFYRPPRSSGSIYLNCLMYRELEAMAYLCRRLDLSEVADGYAAEARRLARAINRHCWDERDGFYYSVDLNLLPHDQVNGRHKGLPRTWDCLIQRVGVWSGFLALWAGLASAAQARRVLVEHFRNPRTFNSPYGVRSLSRLEKMYSVCASNNPSNWLGPVWGVVNYLTFRGLLRYGFLDDARDLAEKTIRLFGRDLERHGALHEYYQPTNGEPILNRGFQNWNYLVLNMIAWLRGEPVVAEF